LSSRKMLAPNKIRDTVTPLSLNESHTVLAKEIFILLKLAVDVSDTDEACAQTHILQWNLDDVMKYGLTFGRFRTQKKSVYMLQITSTNSHEKVYIGKCSAGSEIALYRRDFDPNTMTISTLAATSNTDMLDFLEATVMLAVALASVLRLRMRGSDKMIEVQNQFMEFPKKKPLDAPQSDYLDIFLRVLFNRRVVIRTLH